MFVRLILQLIYIHWLSLNKRTEPFRLFSMNIKHSGLVKAFLRASRPDNVRKRYPGRPLSCETLDDSSCAPHSYWKSNVVSQGSAPSVKEVITRIFRHRPLLGFLCCRFLLFLPSCNTGNENTNEHYLPADLSLRASERNHLSSLHRGCDPGTTKRHRRKLH